MREAALSPHPRSIDGTRRDRLAVGTIVGATAIDGAIVMTGAPATLAGVSLATNATSAMGVLSSSEEIVGAATHDFSTEDPSDKAYACHLASAHTGAVIDAGHPLETVAMILRMSEPRLLVCHHQMAFSPIPRQANFYGPTPNGSWVLERWWRPDLALAEVRTLVAISLVATGFATPPQRRHYSAAMVTREGAFILDPDELAGLVSTASAALDRLAAVQVGATAN